MLKLANSGFGGNSLGFARFHNSSYSKLVQSTADEGDEKNESGGRSSFVVVNIAVAPSLHNQVVLNNFGDKNASSQVKLMKVTLQNMFPSINVATVKLQDCRRVVMFNLDKANGTVVMRHFAVRATPTGITKAIKKARRRTWSLNCIVALSQ